MCPRFRATIHYDIRLISGIKRGGTIDCMTGNFQLIVATVLSVTIKSLYAVMVLMLLEINGNQL